METAARRILDANYNRAKEGLRVCEEVCRFALDDRALTRGFKDARHALTGVMAAFGPLGSLIGSRESGGDVGKTVYGNELQRSTVADIFFANVQRAKESIRVLEEFGKLRSRNGAVRFKHIRYAIYGLEKKTARKLPALRDTR